MWSAELKGLIASEEGADVTLLGGEEQRGGGKKREQSEEKKKKRKRETLLIKGTQRDRTEDLKWGPGPAEYLLSPQQMAT